MMKEGTTAPGGGTAPTNLYNWYAATAGTGTYAVSSGNATASICPKGWSLPTGGPSGDFAQLDIAYGGSGENRTDAEQVAKLMSLENNGPGFEWTGGRSGDSVSNGSSVVHYWSRTTYSEAYVYHMYLNSGDRVAPQGYGGDAKYLGYSVRCVANDIMQNFSASAHSSDANGTTYNLVDTRDNKTYAARKLNDGKIWMVQNLELGGEAAITLTADNSDFPAGKEDWTLNAQRDLETWCTDQTAACYNQQYMMKKGSPDAQSTPVNAPTNLYNWYTATAGTGEYGTGTDMNATASICSKGWKLPTGGAGGDFANLDIAYGGTGANRTDNAQRQKLMSAVNNGPAFSWTGYRNGASILSPSDNALYWSRTARSEASAYDLNLSSGDKVFPQNSNIKYNGITVRCVAAV